MSKKVIGFHYTLKDGSGNLIDSSENKDPLYFLEGTGQIIPGLEKELVGMNPGDKADVSVKSDDAYGQRQDNLVIQVEKAQFPENGASLKVGDLFQLSEDPHSPPFEVRAIEGEKVTMDGNHPLAGVDLFFNVELVNTREATAEELSHGHAHGPDGHGHDH